ncbi:hypothetical protein NDU88_000707, partial [Pleurodeles waltl]
PTFSKILEQVMNIMLNVLEQCTILTTDNEDCEANILHHNSYLICKHLLVVSAYP